MEVSPLVFHVFLPMLSAQSLTISDVTAQLSLPMAQLRCQGCFFGPWAALSQLSQQKNSRMGGAHFCWKYLVYHPPIYIYSGLKDIYTISTEKKHSMPSAGD